MAFTFDATEGGPNANSYVTVAFADDYFGGELYAAEWTALGGSGADLLKKQQALVAATRRLERCFWQGHRSGYTAQALQHPRYGLEDRDGFYYLGTAIIPDVKQACCRLALYYLQQNTGQLATEGLRQFSKLRIANVIDMEMRDSLPDRDDLPTDILNLIYPYMASGPGLVRLVRA